MKLMTLTSRATRYTGYRYLVVFYVYA